jgi:hypothetical protein
LSSLLLLNFFKWVKTSFVSYLIFFNPALSSYYSSAFLNHWWFNAFSAVSILKSLFLFRSCWIKSLTSSLSVNMSSLNWIGLSKVINLPTALASYPLKG